jgi:hypothetical protein
MKNHIAIKTITLCFFISCITLFVLHQSGYFSDNQGSAYQGSHNGGALGAAASDSIYKHKRDSVSRLIISSSKTMVINDLEARIDARLGIKRDTVKADSIRPKRALSSSKVYIPVEPEVSVKKPFVNTDTIKPFTQRKKQ